MFFALTGGFGGGKSTVRDFFERLGWSAFSADALCHGFFDELAPAAVARWGENILSGGRIDRKKLAAIVFDAPEELACWLGLLYPRLDRRLEELKKESAGKHCLVEVPLLYENDMEKNFDGVIAVYSDPALRRRRLRERRGFDDAEIDRRESLQLPQEQKLERADFAIINNGNKNSLSLQVRTLHRRLTSGKP